MTWETAVLAAVVMGKTNMVIRDKAGFVSRGSYSSLSQLLCTFVSALHRLFWFGTAALECSIAATEGGPEQNKS